MTRTLVLKEAGQSVTMEVTEVRKATRGKFPGIEFIGTDGQGPVLVEVPTSSAERQLDRLGLTYQQTQGKVLTIRRDPNKSGGAPYWGLYVEEGIYPADVSIARPSASQTPKTTPGGYTSPVKADHFHDVGHIPGLEEPPLEEPEDVAPVSPGKTNSHEAQFQALCRLHQRCFEAAGKMAGGGISDEALSALTAQLFIACQQKGIVL